MIILFSTFTANEPKQHQLAAVIVITSSIPGPSSSSSSLRRSTLFNLSINPLFRLYFEINNKNTRLPLRTPRSRRLTVRWWATLRRSRHLQQVRSFLLAVPPMAAMLSTAGKGGAVSPTETHITWRKNKSPQFSSSRENVSPSTVSFSASLVCFIFFACPFEIRGSLDNHFSRKIYILSAFKPLFC